MKSLRRMIRFVQPYWKPSILAMALLAGLVATDLLIPRLTQRVIDEGIAQRDMTTIVTTSLLMLAAAVVGALFTIANTTLSVRVSQSVAADLRASVVRKIQSFSFANLDRQQSGQLLVRTTSDVNQVRLMVFMSLRMFTRAPLWMIGSITMLIATSPQLALIMAVLAPLILILVLLFASRAQPLFLAVQARLDRLSQIMQENLAGVRVVKAFVRARHEKARFDEANTALADQTMRVMRLLALLMPTMTLILNLGIAGIIWFGGNLTIGGDLTQGQIIASVNYLTYSLFPILMLGMMIGPLSAADASAGRIWEVLDTTAEVQERPDARAPSTSRGRVAFEDVCFSYDGVEGTEAVLDHINLVAEPGEEVAILGATGSGKSSLIHLIPRFYDATAGRVTIDDIDVRDMPLDALRGQIGIALQETVLFRGTIRDNIRYGRPDAAEEEVVAVAMAAQAHDFITALPHGYDTQVGQRGVNLSGGQKQRIAIARALLIRPRILILDDSTSAVDVETEAKIEDALDELLAGSTSFVIAQRISTVLNADKIVVLEGGKIAACGTHSELIESSPIYQEIYESQLGNGAARNG